MTRAAEKKVSTLSGSALKKIEGSPLQAAPDLFR
jgi:hypothetical protein